MKVPKNDDKNIQQNLEKNSKGIICQQHFRRIVSICIEAPDEVDILRILCSQCLKQESTEQQMETIDYPYDFVNIIKEKINQSKISKNITEQGSQEVKLIQKINKYFETNSKLLEDLHQAVSMLQINLQNNQKEFKSLISAPKINPHELLSRYLREVTESESADQLESSLFFIHQIAHSPKKLLPFNFNQQTLDDIVQFSKKISFHTELSQKLKKLKSDLESIHQTQISVEEKNIQIQNFSIVNEIFDIKSNLNYVYHMVKLSQNELLIVNQDNTVCLVDINSASITRRFRGIQDKIGMDCLFVVSNQIFGVRCCDGNLFLYKQYKEDPIQEIQLNQPFIDRYHNSILYLPALEEVAVAFKVQQNYYSIRMFNYSSKNSLLSLISKEFKGEVLEKRFNCLEKVSDFNFVSGTEDCQLIMWDPKNFLNIIIKKQISSIVSIQSYSETSIIYGCKNGQIQLFDFISFQELSCFSTLPNMNIEENRELFYTINILNKNNVILTKKSNQLSTTILDLTTKVVQKLNIYLKDCSSVSSILLNENTLAVAVLTDQGLKFLVMN